MSLEPTSSAKSAGKRKGKRKGKHPNPSKGNDEFYRGAQGWELVQGPVYRLDWQPEDRLLFSKFLQNESLGRNVNTRQVDDLMQTIGWDEGRCNKDLLSVLRTKLVNALCYHADRHLAEVGIQYTKSDGRLHASWPYWTDAWQLPTWKGDISMLPAVMDLLRDAINNYRAETKIGGNLSSDQFEAAYEQWAALRPDTPPEMFLAGAAISRMAFDASANQLLHSEIFTAPVKRKGDDVITATTGMPSGSVKATATHPKGRAKVMKDDKIELQEIAGEGQDFTESSAAPISPLSQVEDNENEALYYVGNSFATQPSTVKTMSVGTGQSSEGTVHSSEDTVQSSEDTVQSSEDTVQSSEATLAVDTRADDLTIDTVEDALIALYGPKSTKADSSKSKEAEPNSTQLSASALDAESNLAAKDQEEEEVVVSSPKSAKETLQVLFDTTNGGDVPPAS